MTMQDNKLTYSSFTVARSHLLGAEQIVNSREVIQNNRPMLLTPIYLLIGFSLELYFKSFLSHAGLTEDILRGEKQTADGKRLGHRLAELYDQSLMAGLRSPDEAELTFLVGCVAEPHTNHTFRYMKDATLNLPRDAPNLLRVVELMWRLDEHVASVIDLKSLREHFNPA